MGMLSECRKEGSEKPVVQSGEQDENSGREGKEKDVRGRETDKGAI